MIPPADTMTESASVLIVDDVPDNLHLLAGMLKACGFKIRPASSASLALDAARLSPPDIILLDISMPEMSGYEMCELLKADTYLRDIPVLFISALNDTVDKVRAFGVGGVDFITKPFQFEEVEARVRTHLRLRRYQQRLEEMVEDQVKEITESQMATIFALAKLAESRDDSTGRHLARVQRYCGLLARHLRDATPYSSIVDDVWVDNIVHASPLHDVGKVAVPDAILLNPERPSPEEFAVLRTHTTLGAETLAAVYDRYPGNTFLQMGIAIARWHHERWDGGGYPDGLARTEIPLEARVMAIADVYDALRSKRCYKCAFTHQTSCDVIYHEAGTHFDPGLVDAFCVLEREFDSIRSADVPRDQTEPAKAGRG